MTTLQPGTQFGGRYRVERLIAKGGMGAVYEVIHHETQRRRALKVMHPHICESPELRDRFKAEARVAAQIDSEFIVDVFDAGVDEATTMPFLVMELLRGEELGQRLARVGRFAPEEALTYLWQTALALEKTHKASIVHRDLKPENLFLTLHEDGHPRIKVLDFGVAKFVAETAMKSGTTRSVGTPIYMSPEQFRGQRVTPACDNYALGMVAYTLLVGEAYWAEEVASDVDVVAFALLATTGLPSPASERARRRGVMFPPAFDAWFSRATAIEPGQRFASATTAVQALGQVFGIPVGVPQPAFPGAPHAVASPGSLVMSAAFGTHAPAAARTPPGVPGAIDPAHVAAANASGSWQPTGLRPNETPPRPAFDATMLSGGSAATATGASVVGPLLPPPKSNISAVVATSLGVLVLVGASVGAWAYQRHTADATRADQRRDVAPPSASSAAPSSATHEAHAIEVTPSPSLVVASSQVPASASAVAPNPSSSGPSSSAPPPTPVNVPQVAAPPVQPQVWPTPQTMPPAVAYPPVPVAPPRRYTRD